jgi:hypothetical protein
MAPDQQQWHWQEGNKYALECMKALLWLNGGAPIALLTFFGNRGKMLTTISADAIDRSLIFFGIGALASVVLFVMAYITQLYYGREGFTKRAQAIHISTYIALCVALVGLCVGIWFAKVAVVATLG